MTTIQLLGHSEKISDRNPWGVEPQPLYHQWRTADALKNPDIHLVVNSYDTGTGKTQASLLHLFALHKTGKPQDVLFVAPTNALLAQHEEDIREFVAEHNLNFHVQRITAKQTRQLRQQLLDEGHYKTMRVGETLNRFLANYREFAPGEKERKGLILIVNPDIFYYAVMLQYAHYDQRNLFTQFLNNFRYIVIDEFHYYDQKQLVFFLFFFAICQELGYFKYAQRKICLLSATPNGPVQEYLTRLFGSHWQLISPENEPPESDQLATIPTLAPLTLTFSSGQLDEYRPQLQEWLQEGLDGVVISDSLQRINELNSQIKPKLGANLRRITGPEPENKRKSATAAPLILATPTVDIGYNFVKLGKPRQNIDFLICEARFGDDLRQRIGRAGRVLGKSQTDQPGEAIVLVNENALAHLRPVDGQTFSRPQFADFLKELEQHLPHKHNLFRYIASHGITEVFYPIYQVHRLSLGDKRAQLENLYETLCAVFGVRYASSFQKLSAYFRNYYYQGQWLQAVKQDGFSPYPAKTAEQVRRWFEMLSGEERQFSVNEIQPHLDHPNVLGSAERQEALRYFVASQWHLTQSLFSFRDSFQPATAVCYDRDNLFSSEEINQYSILHVAANYSVHWYEGRAQFIELHGKTALKGDLYGRLRSYRDPKLRFELAFDAHKHLQEADRDAFETQWVCKPTALKGLALRAKEKRGDLAIIDGRIKQAIEDQFIPVLLLPRQADFPYVGRAISRLRHSTIFSYNLTVTFDDDSQADYLTFIGKDAWLAHAELKGDIRLAKKLTASAIII